MTDPTPHPEIPGPADRQALNAALAATGADTGFWDDHGWGFGVSVVTRRDDVAAPPAVTVGTAATARRGMWILGRSWSGS